MSEGEGNREPRHLPVLWALVVLSGIGGAILLTYTGHAGVATAVAVAVGSVGASGGIHLCLHVRRPLATPAEGRGRPADEDRQQR
ncbi:hypothetical protein GA0115253_1062013 [Streptomyces sp. Termitarium-T10T-6]|nr:hypothetical protein GA0115253_1062013 [Streptomyces sp. Termitarium-T10T-6]